MRQRVLQLAFVFVVVAALSAPWLRSDDRGVPHYNPAPAKGDKLEPILTRDQLWGANSQYSYQVHAYELAAKIPAVIHQQPCYCYCDRGMGHKSLHSCFSGTHGAQCGTCLQELYYTYQMNKAGKTPAQIRAGIIKGDFKQIDLQTAASIY